MKSSGFFLKMLCVSLLLSLLLSGCGGEIKQETSENTASNAEVDVESGSDIVELAPSTSVELDESEIDAEIEKQLSDAFSNAFDSIQSIDIPEISRVEEYSGGSLSSAFDAFSSINIEPPEVTRVEGYDGGTLSTAFADVFGSMNGGIYRSDLLKIGCRIDDDWNYYSEEEILEANREIVETMTELEVIDEGTSLWDDKTIMDMFAESADSLANVNVNILNAGIGAYSISEDELAEVQLASIPDTYKKWDLIISRDILRLLADLVFPTA